MRVGVCCFYMGERRTKKVILVPMVVTQTQNDSQESRHHVRRVVETLQCYFQSSLLLQCPCLVLFQQLFATHLQTSHHLRGRWHLSMLLTRLRSAVIQFLQALRRSLWCSEMSLCRSRVWPTCMGTTQSCFGFCEIRLETSILGDQEFEGEWRDCLKQHEALGATDDENVEASLTLLVRPILLKKTHVVELLR